MAREPEHRSADVLGMRTSGIGLALVSAVALATAVGGTQWALAADTSPVASIHAGTTTLDDRSAVCPTVDRATTPPARAAGAGNVSLAVPRYTFIDERSAVTRVWTNTEAPPSHKDAFVVVLPGRSHPASAELVTATLALCH